jgi:hypothetical protein
MSWDDFQGRTPAGRARRILASRRFPWLAGLVAVALAAPSVWIGWLADDYTHQLAIVGSEAFPSTLGSSWNPFRFWDGDPAKTKLLMDMGISPWWTDPDIQAVLWRPLAVLTHHLDYAIWPGSPWLMHVHNLLWFGAAVGLAAMLYQRISGAGWAAGLAGLLYALDDAHATPAAWIANRSTLPALVFGVAAILAHDRWRQASISPNAMGPDRRPRVRWGWPILSGACLSLSLLSKEEGLSTVAYLFAYAVFIDRSPRMPRAISLLPCAAIVVAWRAAWAAVGGGMKNVWFYVDPLADPLRYAGKVIEWLPAFLLGQWATPPPDINILFNHMDGSVHPLIWWAGVAFLGVAAAVMVPLLRRDRISGFYAVGMGLSILPPCAGLAGDRLLMFAGVGAMGLLARFIERYLQVMRGDGPKALAGLRRVLTKTFVGVMVAFHLILAPPALLLRSAAPLGPPWVLRQAEARFPVDPDDANKDILLVNAPSVLFVAYAPVMRALGHEPVPRSVRVLSPGFSAVRISRPDTRSLVFRPTPSYLTVPLDRLFRADSAPYAAGDVLELRGMRVVIQELDDRGRPAAVAFHFPVELEDSSLRWFQWKDGKFIPFAPPAVGETVDLAAPIPKLF